MDAHLTQMLQMAAGVLGSILIMAALALLWSKSHSSWLLIALAGAGASLLLRLVVSVMPTLLSQAQMIPLVWSAAALLEAAGFLGYALEQTNRRD
jgi:hypothetical protein